MNCGLRIADCGLGSAGVPPAAFGVPPNALASSPPPTCPGNKEGSEPPMKKFERILTETVYALYYKARVHIQYE